MREEVGEELEWIELLREINRGKWIILFCVFLAGIIAVSLTLGLKKKCYEAVTTMVINKEETQLFYEEKYTQGDITMYEDVINTYMEIAKSKTVLDMVAEQFPQYSREELQNMMAQKVIPNTLIIELKVIGEKQIDMAPIAKAYSNAVIDVCYRAIPAGSLKVLDEARIPDEAQTSGIVLNTVTGILIGLGLALTIIFIRRYRESNKVMRKEQIQSELGIEVWGVNY